MGTFPFLFKKFKKIVERKKPGQTKMRVKGSNGI